ncbi:MAG: hypothetical protein LIO51_04710 [Clostridiales bacterium]|nr:hypothetical protein [Clostridiales bacterium]
MRKRENARDASRPRELVYDWEGLPLLTCRLDLPETAGEGRGPERIRRYYRHVEDCICRWLEREHHRLCTQAQAALDSSKPIPMERVQVDGQGKETAPGRLTVCWTLRWADRSRTFTDCWETETGAPVQARSTRGRWG